MLRQLAVAAAVTADENSFCHAIADTVAANYCVSLFRAHLDIYRLLRKNHACTEFVQIPTKTPNSLYEQHYCLFTKIL
jgi:hypothetical protein